MCTSPLWRLPVYEDAVLRSDKRGYKNGAFIVSGKDTDRLEYLIYKYCHSAGYEMPTQISCGQCLECRIKRSKEWAQRIVLESQLYDHNWFITLTYDDDHLCKNVEWSYSRLDGELGYTPFLVPEDFTSFKKRLLSRMRDKYDYIGIRFFECGEYGSKNGRPHFHAIFFNLPLPDLELVRQVNLGGRSYCYYRSKMIEECWENGYVLIGEVNWETAAYVARYVTKKFHSEEEKTYKQVCELSGVPQQPPEFINMSRRPGIAREYYDQEHNKFYENDTVVLPNGRAVQPCKYFDKLFDLEYPEEMASIKAERQRIAQLRDMNKYFGKTAEEAAELRAKEAEAKRRTLDKLVRPL